MSEKKSVLCLIVSGFLGSGKTTLVRHLLETAQRQGRIVAVISNEFGELGIDEALLGGTAEGYVELEGGCVCCKLADDLVETLQLLYDRVHPDQVIVETSGVALPYDTQLNFWREPVAQWVGDDLAVVVVNAEQVATGRDLEGTFEDQVSSADLLLLNKADLVAPEDLPALEERLLELAPDTAIVRCVHGRVDPGLLFMPQPGEARRERRAPEPLDRSHRHEDFACDELSVESGIDPRELEERLQRVPWIRAKGFVQTSAGVLLVQGVGDRLELSSADAPPPEGLIGRVVLIRRSDGPPEAH